MELDGMNFLVSFYNNIDLFLIIFVRLFGFFVILPIFTSGSIPMTSKVAFIFTFAYLIFYSNKVSAVYLADNVFGYGFLIMQEFIIGLAMGYVVFTLFSILYLAGHIIDYQIGYSMLSVLDPVSQIQVPVIGNLYYFVVSAFLVQTGGLNKLIHAVFYSFEAIPIGTATLLFNSKLTATILELTTNFFVIGVKFAMPIMGTVFVLDIALGLLAKASPKMQVFALGMPLKNLVGLILLFIISPIVIDMYNQIFNESYRTIFQMIRSLSP